MVAFSRVKVADLQIFLRLNGIEGILRPRKKVFVFVDQGRLRLRRGFLSLAKLALGKPQAGRPVRKLRDGSRKNYIFRLQEQG